MKTLSKETSLPGAQAIEIISDRINNGEISKIISLGAHPDDQLFWAGSLRHLVDSTKKSSSLIGITDLTLSKGENGESLSTNHSPEELADARTMENYLGFSAIFDGVHDKVSIDFNQMDVPDGAISRYEDETVNEIINNEGITSDSVILTFNEVGGDNHPDHIATNRIARELAKHYGAALLEFGLPDNTDSTVKLSSQNMNVSRGFVASHRSQFGDEGSKLQDPHNLLVDYNSLTLWQ